MKTKDNQILGSFKIMNIPPGPPGSEKFEVEFDLDADGILTVSATHKNSGRKESLTINAKTSRTTEEIESMILNAQRMKILDEKEESRIFSKNELEIFCHNFFMERINQIPNTNSMILREEFNECLTWVSGNADASEETFRLKHEGLFAMLEEFDSCDIENKTQLKRVSRADQSLTTQSCIQKGDEHLQLPQTSLTLTEANEWFYRAYVIANEKRNPGKMCVALQRMGQTIRLLLEGSNELPEDEKIRLISKGIVYLARGVEMLEKRNSVPQIEVSKMENDIKKIIQYSDREFEKGNMSKRKLEVVDRMLCGLGNVNRIRNKNLKIEVLTLLCNKLDLIIKKIDIHIEEGNVKEATDLVSQTEEPVNNILLLIGSQEFKSAEAQAIASALETSEEYNTNAIALQQLANSQAILDHLNSNTLNIDEKINSAFLALDLVQEAQRNSTKRQKIFCQAKLLEGKLYSDLLLNKVNAKNCFREVIDTALTLQYLNVAWLKEAEVLFQRLKKEELENLPKQDKSSVLKELKAEILMLDAASEQSDENFISFLLENFPPKHKGNVATPETGNGDHSKIKKAYQKLSTLYHADKIDVDEYGLSYKVLCEEIQKRVNSKYASMK